VRAFQAFIILGGIFLIVGVYLGIPPTPVTGSSNASIPAGAYYYHFGFNVLKAGLISGTFSEASGNSIALYIFNAAQYSTWQQTGAVDHMFQTFGAIGSFSASIQSPGQYYIVLTHVAGTSGLIQNVQLNYSLDGTNIVFLGSAIILVIIGAALVSAGYAKKRKMAIPRTITDVTMFEAPKGQQAEPGLSSDRQA
jgi:hypothetical protein